MINKISPMKSEIISWLLEGDPSIRWQVQRDLLNLSPAKYETERRKITALLSGTLLRALIAGSRYPDGLFSAVIRRIRSDSTINYIRACIIKGYLTRNQRKEVSMGLDPNRKEPAYRLGRLFAVLEKTSSTFVPQNDLVQLFVHSILLTALSASFSLMSPVMSGIVSPVLKPRRLPVASDRSAQHRCPRMSLNV
jgi:hypothetical protein